MAEITATEVTVAEVTPVGLSTTSTAARGLKLMLLLKVSSRKGIALGKGGRVAQAKLDGDASDAGNDITGQHVMDVPILPL